MKNIFIFVLSIIILCIFAFTFIKVKENYNISFEYADDISNISNNNTILQKNITEKPSRDIFHLADVNSPDTAKPILRKKKKKRGGGGGGGGGGGDSKDNSDRYFYLANEYNIPFAVLPDSYHSTDFSVLSI
ncbi:hypothetical protein OFR22_05385 [Brachyspira hyodysenteriae]|uniref:hypothetical protein n=1 Tax=Brachyspira hyodysenteriae TaxID=159 RepID=UPI0022CE2FEC|nr:hypothetical protein [Brachyspira hyodysenteriae]MCZ9994809.1 hypothetical protein [Brachyspira hyodysenteriae]